MFIILFGSQASQKQTPLSDTDIAIYSDNPLSYIEQGNLIIDFEQQYKTPVDLVILNDIIETNPVLAYNIMFTGKVIQCDSTAQYNAVKFRVLQHYLDTVELRNHFMRKFEERVRQRSEKREKNERIFND